MNASISPLIDANAAWAAISRGEALAVDCRFDLADKARGENDYQRAHVPGAVYAHLDRDLADLSVRGRGRHPMPSAEAFSALLSRWGVTSDLAIIAYDDANGAYAARLWWMLGLVGHRHARVLDGGWAAWRAAGLPESSEPVQRAPTSVQVKFDESTIVSSEQIERYRRDPAWLLLDARAAPRFRGEVEPLDPIAGHVPGARNRPFADNLIDGGRFRAASELRDAFLARMDGRDPAHVVHMCGSGVTACHNVLAMAHAGLPGARVYAGSWSEWISDPTREIARGE